MRVVTRNRSAGPSRTRHRAASTGSTVALRTEIDEIHATLSEQIAAIRVATLQLSDSQYRSRPLRSQLSLSGLIKHSCHIFTQTLRQLGQEPPATDPVSEFYGSFTPDEAESSQVLLGRFDSLSERYLSAIGGLKFALEGLPGNDFVQPWHPEATTGYRSRLAQEACSTQVTDQGRNSNRASPIGARQTSQNP